MIDIRQLPNISIAQKDFVQEFYAEFNYAPPASGLLRNFANVEPFLYIGAMAGSEFFTYANTKLYVCFDFEAAYTNIPSQLRGEVIFYDELNVIHLYGQSNDITYEAAFPAIWYNKNNVHLKNFWFSRLTWGEYIYMKFIGYRITLN